MDQQLVLFGQGVLTKCSMIRFRSRCSTSKLVQGVAREFAISSSVSIICLSTSWYSANRKSLVFPWQQRPRDFRPRHAKECVGDYGRRRSGKRQRFDALGCQWRQRPSQARKSWLFANRMVIHAHIADVGEGQMRYRVVCFRCCR